MCNERGGEGVAVGAAGSLHNTTILHTMLRGVILTYCTVPITMTRATAVLLYEGLLGHVIDLLGVLERLPPGAARPGPQELKGMWQAGVRGEGAEEEESVWEGCRRDRWGRWRGAGRGRKGVAGPV